jgi:hypothetical protein
MGIICLPRLDLLQSTDVVDGLLHIPHLIRIDHQYRPSRASILAPQLLALGVAWYRAGREVLRVINDRTYDFCTPEIVGLVRANFHLEVVEAGSDSLLSETCDFLVSIPC